MKTVQDGRFQKYVPGFHEYIQLLKDERERIGYQEETLVLTHLDIAPKNIMIDPHTSRITGIIDWEWCTLSMLTSNH
jgi:aminoglycoside phosphotransferase (APT) family kinase protein